MTESFLQYVWKFRLLNKGLETSEGESVKVISPGDLNTDAGPDFYNARLVVGDITWVGTIEIHVKSSDWYLHGHTADKRYRNVILHVVYIHDRDVFLPDGRKLPVLVVDKFLSPDVLANFESLMSPPAYSPIACSSFVSHIPDFLLSSYFERLSVERLERKTNDVKRILNECAEDWELATFLMTAHYFGGKVNGFPFEHLAKLLHRNILARWRDNPMRIEALLMGQAGFLDVDFVDDYPRALKVDFESLSGGFNLPKMDPSQWKFFRIRPNGFPTVRISQFSHLICKTPHLFSSLISAEHVDQLLALLSLEASDYWDNHFRFDTPSRKYKKRLGEGMAVSILINAWIPILFEYGKSHSLPEYMDLAVDFLSSLGPESNSVVRLWQQSGVSVSNAAHSQGALQLYDNYCIHKRCLDCRIGYHYLKNKK